MREVERVRGRGRRGNGGVSGKVRKRIECESRGSKGGSLARVFDEREGGWGRRRVEE